MEAPPKTAPKTPWTFGRVCRGTTWTMQTIEPAKIPAAPTPAIALPMMNAVDVGAAPQSAEAASKMTMLVKKVVFTSKNA